MYISQFVFLGVQGTSKVFSYKPDKISQAQVELRHS